MDNCTGQNKNRMVIRFVLLMVELNYYEEVQLLFLVTGHTKNSADRLFNLLKQVYRKQNLFTMKQLIDSLGTNPLVTPAAISSDDLLDFDEYEDRIYRRLDAGSVKKNHVFWSTAANKGTLFFRQSIAHAGRGSTLINTDSAEQREELLGSFPLSIDKVQPPGLKHIKMVEMFSKWRKYVPPQDQSDPIYGDPGEAIMKEIRDKRSGSRKRKAEEAALTDGAAAPPEDTVETGFEVV